MAIRVRLEKSDIAAGKLLDPGIYLAQVDSITEGKSKGDGSVVITVKMHGLEGEAEDVPLTAFFSEKFMMPWVNFLKAFGIEVEAGKEYEVDNLQGEILRVAVDNEEYNNKMQNRVRDFLPK